MCGAAIVAFEQRCRSCGEALSRESQPANDARFDDSMVTLPLEPAVSLAGTILPRHLAAILDNVAAMILGVVASGAIPESLPVVKGGIVVVVFFGYYLLTEGLIGATPGKLLAGLVVVQFDGSACTWRQVLIRTLFRVLEVNPVLFGALPAAARIVFSKHRQRFGDHIAGTIVAPRRRIAKKRQQLAASAS
jgi:uncharacterized RDD family membrane protein YckC